MKFQAPKFRAPKLRVEQPKSTFAEGHHRWTNEDLDPVPRHKRKWTAISLISYWQSDAWNTATWQFASSIIAIGLTWRESIGIVAISFFTISIVIALNGAMGVLYHAPFPVLARASWGFWGSYVAIISRAILAIFWFAIQTMNGASATQVMLGAIWPSFLRLKNHIPESQGITTQLMICFLLFWIAQLPFLYMHPNTLRWMFLAKGIIVPIAWIAILIWAFVSTDGGGSFWAQKSTITGPAYSWAYLAGLTSVIGNFCTLSVNQADFSRYSRVSVKWQWMYVPMLPIVFTFVAFIGISATSAGAERYGKIQWNPMDLIANWTDRSCRFFAAFSFAFASLGVNISANSLSAANDLMALFPSYINIRRGQLICALLAWALVPWKVLASAGSFLNFMAAYAIFLGPIAIIIVLDFFIIHHRKYDCLQLYRPEGIYRYTWGTNWRAIGAFLVGVAPNLPGFVNGINNNIDVGVGIHPYQFGWFLGTAGTGLVYFAVSKIWPPHETMIDRAVLPDEIFDAMEIDGVPVEGSDVEKPEKSGFRQWAEKAL
ncbi:NCS1 allantoate transporter [Trichodelitschia bisporula]|uniref:NCS1 allantoate transporter n=1 Tax=Trichodelitschia bisporula TaxID=703511 RepID=A0A6G1I475_9PEZI|nr:NCS1 allantoate transporter [Trichodelitschia bisporula]